MSSTTRKITLKPSSRKGFEVDEAVALESNTIKRMIEDGCTDSVIDLPDITSNTLAKVIEFCTKHVDAAMPDKKLSDDDLKAWDTAFIRRNHGSLVSLTLAAKYLDIRSLIDLTVQTATGSIPDEGLVDAFCTLRYLLCDYDVNYSREKLLAESGPGSEFEVFCQSIGLDLSLF